jgi:hypothetical protein
LGPAGFDSGWGEAYVVKQLENGSKVTDIDFAFDVEEFSLGAVPEPSTLVALTGLLGMGLIGHWWRRRKVV